MKIEYLREFVILSKYLNYTIAAERMFTTQPVLSRHIASLENELGVTLLSRNKHEVALTNIGEFVLEKATKILNEYDGLCYQLAVRKSGIKAAIRIGVPNYALDDYLRDIPRQMAQLRPDIKLSFVTSDPNEVISELILDKTDIIVVPKFSSPKTIELISHDLYQEKLGVFVSRKNPLSKKKIITVTDLKDENFLSVSGDYFNNYWQFIKELCVDSGYEPNVPVLLNQMEAVLLSVQKNEGIVILGDHMRKFVSDEVAFIDLVGENCFRTISLFYKANNPICDEFVKEFINLF